MSKIVQRIPRVAVVLERQRSTHMQLLRGLLRYVQMHNPWTLDIRLGREEEAHLPDLAAVPPDGIVAKRIPAELARLAARRRIPTVLLFDAEPSVRSVAWIDCDNAAVARLAADHLAGRGFVRFGFVGERGGEEWSRKRGEAFARELAGRGFACETFRRGAGRADSWREALREWLLALEKPAAIFAAYDIVAREVLDVCTESGIDVPGEIAVLGVDDDEVLCETASPPLSSISLDAENAGFRLAETLDRAMAARGKAARGNRAGPETFSYGPRCVVERRSTAHDPIRDDLVRRCRALVEASVPGRFGVADLARSLHVSRRTLETRFRAAVGRTLHAEITEQRIRRARRLLSQTAMSQAEIAEACGFTDASHMNVVFRRRCGAPPGVFRASGAPPRPL